MPFPTSSPSSPVSPKPVRFGLRSEQLPAATSESFSGRLRRASTRTKTNKGKQPIYDADVAAPDHPTTHLILPARSTETSSHSSPYTSSTSSDTRPSSADGIALRKTRTSLLVAATDALGLKFGRKKYHVRPSPMPIILPEVIEITAQRRDEDAEERDRLRDMAAQSIGIPVTMHPDGRSLNNSVDDEEDEQLGEELTGRDSAPPVLDLENRYLGNVRRDHVSGLAAKSLPGSCTSISPPHSGLSNRLRSGSLMAHSRSNSMTLSPVPAFPSTITALTPFKQMDTVLFKFYPPSSLRIFALHKNWRSRYMVLSSPTTLMRRNSSPPVSYLHLFKASDGEEREIERLEINEDSVVFVAEEDVATRKHVVKVAGVDVGALKKELNHEEGGRTMWFLHIGDPAEAQKWITAIKTSILGQRTMRAGLGFSSGTFGGIEPRGDMDVMLSMRAQGLITSPGNSTRLGQGLTNLQTDRNYASSISSHRSQATVSRSTHSGTVSAIKGLFATSTRPRSPSVPATDNEHEMSQDGSSYGTGNHLLSVNDGPSTPPLSTHDSLLHSDGAATSLEHRLAQKIIPDRSAIWASSEAPVPGGRNHKALSLQTVSLQPPPRKRWTSFGPADQDAVVFANTNASRAVNHNAGGEDASQGDLASLSGFRFGSPVHWSRAGSVHSIASADNSASMTDISSTSTKRSSRRWSRQGVLPRRLTPPSGPPPSAPTHSSEPYPPPTLSDRTPSEASSRFSSLSRQSMISSLPSFSKRASGSSFLSISGTNASSASVSQPPSGHGHRTSMPPPSRPAPISALPPPPEQNEEKTEEPISPKSFSFRESVTQRAARLSVISLKASPAMHADDIVHPSHRRSSSLGGYSPPPPTSPFSPIPPPVGPLPPTPVTPHADAPSQSSITITRRTSIKQRLRILSTPAPTAADTSSSHLPQPIAIANSLPPTPLANAGVSSPGAIPITPTPIAEKIVQYDDESSFLQLTTPVTPYFPPSRTALPTLPEPNSEISHTPLSPPPRRRISVIGIVPEILTPADEKPATEEPQLVSLARPDSVISVGLVSM